MDCLSGFMMRYVALITILVVVVKSCEDKEQEKMSNRDLIKPVSTMSEVVQTDGAARSLSLGLLSLYQSPDYFLMLLDGEVPDDGTAPLRADDIVPAFDLTELNATMAIRQFKGYVPVLFAQVTYLAEPHFYLQFQLSPGIQWTYVLTDSDQPIVQAEPTSSVVHRLLGGFAHPDGVSYISIRIEDPGRALARSMIHTGLPLDKCLATDAKYLAQGYVASAFQTVQDAGGRVHCSGEWTPSAEGAKRRSQVVVNNDLTPMLLQMGVDDGALRPRQISGYFGDTGVWQHVLLLSDYRQPDYPPLWKEDDQPNADYLKPLRNGNTESAGCLNATQIELIDKAVARLMTRQQLPSLSLAFGNDERLLFAAAYGYATVRAPTKAARVTDPYLLASVSKTLTSTAVFRLVEQGRLKISDRVFGPQGLLKCDLGSASCNETLQMITVGHLLQHISGGWSSSALTNATAALVNDQIRAYRYAVNNVPLKNEPGSKYDYSNTGYLLLGEILTRLCPGMTYADIVQENVLRPLGVNTKTLSAPHLRNYASHPTYYDAYYLHPEPRVVNVTSLSSAAGLRLSVVDLMKFLAGMDERPKRPDLLPEETLRLMTTPSRESTRDQRPYAYGWVVDTVKAGWGGFSHSGYIYGGESIMIRGATDGVSAAALSSANLHGQANWLDVFLRGLVQQLGPFHENADCDLFTASQ